MHSFLFRGVQVNLVTIKPAREPASSVLLARCRLLLNDRAIGDDLSLARNR
jgi:hypothetical protein